MKSPLELLDLALASNTNETTSVEARYHHSLRLKLGSAACFFFVTYLDGLAAGINGSAGKASEAVTNGMTALLFGMAGAFMYNNANTSAEALVAVTPAPVPIEAQEPRDAIPITPTTQPMDAVPVQRPEV